MALSPFTFLFSIFIQVLSQNNYMTDKEMTADEGSCLEMSSSSSNGYCHPLKQNGNGIIIPVTLDDNCGWLVPMAEFDSETSLIVESA